MPHDVPQIEPLEITAGTTVKWMKSFSAHPASVWTLSYSLRGSTQLDVTATASGDLHEISITPVQTAALNATDADLNYWWTAFITDGTDRFKIGEGQLVVSPDLAEIAASYDGRTHAAIVLDALEAMLTGKASKDQQSVWVGDRKIERLSPAELTEWIKVYESKVEKEKRDLERKQGRKRPRSVQARFVNTP